MLIDALREQIEAQKRLIAEQRNHIAILQGIIEQMRSGGAYRHIPDTGRTLWESKPSVRLTQQEVDYEAK